MFCKYCGAQLTDNSIFCEYCGKNLKAQESQQSVQMPQTVQTPKAVQMPQMVQYQPKSQKRLSKFDKTRICFMVCISVAALLVVISFFLPYCKLRTDISDKKQFISDKFGGEEYYVFEDEDGYFKLRVPKIDNPSFVEERITSDGLVFSLACILIYPVLPIVYLLVGLRKYKRSSAILSLVMALFIFLSLGAILSWINEVNEYLFTKSVGFYMVPVCAAVLVSFVIAYLLMMSVISGKARACIQYVKNSIGTSGVAYYESIKAQLKGDGSIVDEMVNDEYLFLAESNGRKCLVINEAKSI